MAQAALIEGVPRPGASSVRSLERLLVLVEVYRALHKARVRRGALDFDAAEAEFRIDARSDMFAPSSCARATMRTV